MFRQAKPNDRRHKYRRACWATGLMLAGTITASAVGADTATTAASAPDAERCGRHGEVNLAKMNERAAATFAAADANGDGEITVTEFIAFEPMHGRGGQPGMKGPHMAGPAMGMAHFGAPPTAEERDARMQTFQADLFKALDKDADGQLSPAEFAKAWETAQTMMKQQMFARLDKNGDGVLTKDEFPPFAQKMATMDSNNDGTVSRDEMKAARAAKHGQTGQSPN
jgi:Ca2+-binding EF-hand superfamily protein